jgi:hypothetical protein
MEVPVLACDAAVRVIVVPVGVRSGVVVGRIVLVLVAGTGSRAALRQCAPGNWRAGMQQSPGAAGIARRRGNRATSGGSTAGVTAGIGSARTSLNQQRDRGAMLRRLASSWRAVACTDSFTEFCCRTWILRCARFFLPARVALRVRHAADRRATATGRRSSAYDGSCGFLLGQVLGRRSSIRLAAYGERRGSLRALEFRAAQPTPAESRLTDVSQALRVGIHIVTRKGGLSVGVAERDCRKGARGGSDSELASTVFGCDDVRPRRRRLGTHAGSSAKKR